MTKHITVHTEKGQKPETVYFVDETLVAESGTKYRLGRHLRRGNNGTIFECRAEGTPALLAVKFLHRLDDQRRRRFEFEVNVLSDLQHSGLLRCVDIGEADTTHNTPVPFMVTEIFERNLHNEVNELGPLSPPVVVNRMVDLCDAFAHLHSRGVIHRDVKPANVFLAAGKPVLGDFGLAKTATELGIDRYYRQDITAAGEMIGPILWMSPELVRYIADKKAPVDHRSDLFQLGLLLWFMLTGENARGTLDPDDDPTGQLFPLVQKLLHSKPDKRFQSATEVKEALLEARRT
jgi:eukaryotic-like serine/threonine-protein kinase